MVGMTFEARVPNRAHCRAFALEFRFDAIVTSLLLFMKVWLTGAKSNGSISDRFVENRPVKSPNKKRQILSHCAL